MQQMLDTTHKIASRYRIKFGTSKSKVIQTRTPSDDTPLHKFTIGDEVLEHTETYKYLGVTLNNSGNFDNHITNIKGKTEAITQSIINTTSNPNLKGIQMKAIWKLHETCLIPTITYALESLPLNTNEMKRLQSIKAGATKRFLKCPQSTPEVGLTTETADMHIENRIFEKKANYYIKKLKTQNTTHLEGTKWHTDLQEMEKTLQVDLKLISHLPNTRSKEAIKTALAANTMRQLLTNESQSKTRHLVTSRDATNISTRPTYMEILSRSKCSAIFKYKCKMINTKTNFPGMYKTTDNRCRLCNEQTESQEHLFFQCRETRDITENFDPISLETPTPTQNLLKQATIINNVMKLLEENPVTHKDQQQDTNVNSTTTQGDD